MAISLTEAKAIAEIADVLYSFLPGSFSSVTFETVAKEAGVGLYWQSGSKKPAITALLDKTLEFSRSRFEPLIVGIVRAGLQYRQRKNDPVRKAEILVLNASISNIGFKFPDLWDAAFLDSLDQTSSEPTFSEVKAGNQSDQTRHAPEAILRERLNILKEKFYQLCAQQNRQQAGLDLEKLLEELFELYALNPRGSFRVQGEQIDGSFDLGGHVYLVEAKWLSQSVSEEPLLVFRGKLEGKSAWTRGVFIALNGFSDLALQAITRGKQPTFFLMEGYDLTMVLEGQCRLDDLLRAKVRLLSEEGKVFASVREILNDSKNKVGAS
ncbi:MAG: restriction endonuclease [Magnetococcales bacterium]|nr:restriction endonuclease [Magnetococcales bacterium]